MTTYGSTADEEPEQLPTLLPEQRFKKEVREEDYYNSIDLAKVKVKNRTLKTKLKKIAGAGLVAESDPRGPVQDGPSKAIRTTSNIYDTFGIVQPPHNLLTLAKAYEKSPPNQAAIQAKTANVVGLGFDFIYSHDTRDRISNTKDKKSKDALIKRLKKAKSELYALWDEINEDKDFNQTLVKAGLEKYALGNGYIEVGRDSEDNISYTGYVPGITVRVRQAKDGFVQIVGNQATFFRNFGGDAPDPLNGDPQPNELIHLKVFSPLSDYYGIPDTITAADAIASNEYVSRYNMDYFKNKATPRTMIIIRGGKTLSTTFQREMMEFLSGLKGEHHRSIIVPLPSRSPGEEQAEVKIEKIEDKMQDSSFNSLEKINQSKILMSHRVPGSKVGSAENVSVALARDYSKTFKEEVCQPDQRLIEKIINRIVKEFTDVFILKLNELTLTSEDEKSKTDERYLRNGVILPNEIRTRQGMEPIEGGDKPPVLSGGQAANARQTRERDSERSANESDSGSGPGRNEQGEGRAAE